MRLYNISNDGQRNIEHESSIPNIPVLSSAISNLSYDTNGREYSLIEKYVNPLGTVTTITVGSGNKVKTDILDEVVSQLSAEDCLIHENCDESLFRPVVTIFCDRNASAQKNASHYTNDWCKPPEEIETKLIVPVVIKEEDDKNIILNAGNKNKKTFTKIKSNANITAELPSTKPKKKVQNEQFKNVMNNANKKNPLNKNQYKTDQSVEKPLEKYSNESGKKNYEILDIIETPPSLLNNELTKTETFEKDKKEQNKIFKDEEENSTLDDLQSVIDPAIRNNPFLFNDDYEIITTHYDKSLEVSSLNVNITAEECEKEEWTEEYDELKNIKFNNALEFENKNSEDLSLPILQENDLSDIFNSKSSTEPVILPAETAKVFYKNEIVKKGTENSIQRKKATKKGLLDENLAYLGSTEKISDTNTTLFNALEPLSPLPPLEPFKLDLFSDVQSDLNSSDSLNPCYKINKETDAELTSNFEMSSDEILSNVVTKQPKSEEVLKDEKKLSKRQKRKLQKNKKEASLSLIGKPLDTLENQKEIGEQLSLITSKSCVIICEPEESGVEDIKSSLQSTKEDSSPLIEDSEDKKSEIKTELNALVKLEVVTSSSPSSTDESSEDYEELQSSKKLECAVNNNITCNSPRASPVKSNNNKIGLENVAKNAPTKKTKRKK